MAVEAMESIPGVVLSYVEKQLIPGETLQYQTKLHWIVMLGHVAAAVVLELLAIVFLIASFSSHGAAEDVPPRWVTVLAAFLWFAVGAIFLGAGLLKRNATEIAVTNKRVIAKTGVANRRSIEILLSRIESVVVDESAMGRVLGYGMVIVRGTGGTPEVFEKIYHPLDFRAQVQRQIAGEPKSS